MLYSEPLYRPPSEAYSAIIQATQGCSHNKCAFCSMYKFKKFKVLQLEELKQHIDAIAKFHPRAEKVFIADGNALVLPTDYWLELLAYVKNVFPHVKQISSYATPKDIIKKSPTELKNIHEHGLSLLYMGVETGNNELLAYIEKGVNSSEVISAGQKAIVADFKLSVTIIAGLGGENNYQRHAIDTAKVMNAIQPHYIGMLSLMVERNTKIFEDIEKGKYKLPSPIDYLKEAKLFLENINLKNTIFRSNHASNYVSLEGILNADQQKLIDKIDYAINNPQLLKPEHFRGL